jgi:hypothetical protein
MARERKINRRSYTETAVMTAAAFSDVHTGFLIVLSPEEISVDLLIRHAADMVFEGPF